MTLFYKEGTIINGNFNRKFLVKRSAERYTCKDCVFSVRYNSNFDSLRTCDERRDSYLNLNRKLYYNCKTLVPFKCVFAELKGGV